jgi:two-component system, NtrC family, response regulator GlrR
MTPEWFIRTILTPAVDVPSLTFVVTRPRREGARGICVHFPNWAARSQEGEGVRGSNQTLLVARVLAGVSRQLHARWGSAARARKFTDLAVRFCARNRQKHSMMIGQSDAFRVVQALIEKMAVFDAPVLIEGETGTGKELAARAIHYCGTRRGGPFVPVNCGALPDSLIENELFGHRRGAFTDARDDQPGLAALASGGTLFLDEVDALTRKGQVTLLRFLQDQQFRPLGARGLEQADVRIIAASNRNLEQQVEAGEFRLDLLYRLRLMHLRLPPLRERRGDVALLAGHFIKVAGARFKKPAIPLSAATLAWFERYSWPGNIRELENLILREFLLTDAEQISIPAPGGLLSDAAPPNGHELNYSGAKSRAIAEFENRFLARLIEEANGNVTVAARMSGTERRHLGRLLKKYSIPKLRSRP